MGKNRDFYIDIVCEYMLNHNIYVRSWDSFWEQDFDRSWSRRGENRPKPQDVVVGLDLYSQIYVRDGQNAQKPQKEVKMTTKPQYLVVQQKPYSQIYVREGKISENGSKMLQNDNILWQKRKPIHRYM